MPLLKGMDLVVIFRGIRVPVPITALGDTEEYEYGPRPRLALGSLELAVVDGNTLTLEVEDALRDVGAYPLLYPVERGPIELDVSPVAVQHDLRWG